MQLSYKRLKIEHHTTAKTIEKSKIQHFQKNTYVKT